MDLVIMLYQQFYALEVVKRSETALSFLALKIFLHTKEELPSFQKASLRAQGGGRDSIDI